MSFIFAESRTKTCLVTAVGTNQVFPICRVKKGDLVVATALRRTIPADGSTDSTWQFALTTAGLLLGATIDTEGTLNDVVGSSVSNFRVTADDTLELRYVQGTTDGATAPQARANAVVLKNKGDL